MTKKVLFLITITDQLTLQCHIINKNKTEIKINENQPITISFNMNEIIICKETENQINFINEWINQPEIFKEYTITFQEKEYNVIAEVLFSLIIYQFKQIIEKQFIISERRIKLPQSSQHLFINRLKVALDAVGLKGHEFDIPDFDYEKQGEIFDEILMKYKEFNKYKILFNKRNISHLIDNTKPFKE